MHIRTELKKHGTQVAGLVAYKMTSAQSPPGAMAMTMRSTMSTSGRTISPYKGPKVIWNGLNGRKGLALGNGSVAVS